MGAVQSCIVLLFSIPLLSACEEPKIIELYDADGKTSPYQHVERVVFNPIEEFIGCTESQIKALPDHTRLSNMLPTITRSVSKPETFNQLENWLFGDALPQSKISTDPNFKIKNEGELKITIKLLHNCQSNPKKFSLTWETKRHPSRNSYVRTNHDQWLKTDHDLSSHEIKHSILEKKLHRVIEANRFQRYEFDTCSRIKQVPPSRKDIICKRKN